MHLETEMRLPRNLSNKEIVAICRHKAMTVLEHQLLERLEQTDDEMEILIARIEELESQEDEEEI